MKLRQLIFTYILLYTIIFNNSIKIFATDEKISPIDMSTEESENTVPPTAHMEGDKPVIAARSAVVIDADTGVVVFGKDEHQLCYPASVTKTLTCLIAAEETEPTDLVTFSENAVYGIGEGSSSIAVRVGETLNMEQCMHAMLMASANDVCVGVAEFIDGDINTFAERMNKKAKEVGALDSHFANPHGYHDENHYTTAYDIAMIVKAAVKEPKFLESYGCLTYTIPKTNMVDEERILNNRSKILFPDSEFYYKYIKGSKTGYTSQAGNTLVSYAEKDGIGLICCVLADRGTNTFEDTSLLFDYCFGKYSSQTLLSPGEQSVTVPVEQAYKDKTILTGEVQASVKDECSAVVPDFINKSTISVSKDVPEKLTAPVKAGDVIGKVSISYGGVVFASADLIADNEVQLIPENVLRLQEIKRMFLKYAPIVAMCLLGLMILYSLVHVFHISKGNRGRRLGR